MKTYYTKCGKVSFQKSTTAAVTRFEDINEHCEECPYIQHSTTYRGGQEVPITFCQAGSKEPNHKMEYSTTNENDATTLSILSLDMELLKQIHEYASSLDGCLRSYASWPNVFHGMDRDDCRKSMPLGFESNKKGKAAKRAIIDKFFSKQKIDTEDNTEKCGSCENYHPDEECPGTGRCPERMTIRAKEQAACQKHKPKKSTPACEVSRCSFHACMSDHCQLEHVIENAPHTVREMVDKVMEYCPDSERLVNSMSMGCGPVDSVKCRINRNGWCGLDTASFEDMDAEAANCGFIRVNERYLMNKFGVPYKDLNCGHCQSFSYTEGSRSHGKCNIDKENQLESRYEGAMACGDFKKKEDDTLKCTKHHCPFNDDKNSECGFNPTTDEVHRISMEGARDIHDCTNKQLLDVLNRIESSDKTCEGCCYLQKSGKCNRIGSDREATPETPRCGWYWNVKTEEMGEEHFKELYPDGKYENLESKVELELVKPEDRYTEDSAPAATFDYSTVDEDTASFLVEKANNIIFIKAGTSYAIGKELKEAQDKLASHDKTKGVFIKWIQSLEISDETAYNYIHTYNFVSKQFGNIEDAKSFLALPQKLQYAVSKPSAPAELQKAVIEGDITSHKQYKELEQKLKEAEAKAENERSAYERVSESYSRLEKTNHKHYETAEQLRKELETVKKQGADPEKVKKLEADLKEAQRQVDILTDELLKPVELTPAVVEKVPEEIEKELEALRKKTGLEQDYMFVSDILGMFRIAHPSRLKGWAKVIVKENAEAKVKEIRNELINLGTTIESMIDYLDEEVQMK